MLITKDDQLHAEILQMIRQRSFSEREGIHFSDLNYCLRKAFYRNLYPAIALEREAEQTTLLFSVGHSWQHWLTGQGDEPTTEVDGIKCSIDYKYKDGIYWEIKATYMSSNKNLEDQTGWLRQCMAYCKVAGVLEFNIIAIYLMGSWGGVFNRKKDADRRRPLMNAWHIEFTQEEIDHNWTLALLKKGMLEDAINDGVPPDPHKFDYECGYCQWNKNKMCPIPRGAEDGEPPPF